MPDIIEQLQHYAEAAEAAVPVTTPDNRREPHSTSRWRSPLTFAAVALVAVAVGAAFLVADRAEAPTGLTTDRSGGAAAVPGWSTFPAAPIAGRVGAAAVASSDELIVWGGRNGEVLGDGAAFSFEEDRWRTIAPSPLEPRTFAVAVWTGEEMLIWGGVDDSSTPLKDGAAYDPAADSWRSLPANDVGAVDSITGSVWTGDELLLVGVTESTDGSTSGTWALDPSEGRWRALDPMPAPPGGGSSRRGVAVEWTGSEALVVSIVDGEPVTVDRLDVDGGAWGERITTGAPGLDTGPDGVVLTGSRLVIVGNYAPGAIVDTETGTVSELAPSNSDLRFAAVAIDDAVTVGDRWLDLSTGDWHSANPVPGPFRQFPVVVADGQRSYVWGGDACGAGAGCVALIDPEIGISWAPPSDATGEPTTTEPETPSAPPFASNAALRWSVVLVDAGDVLNVRSDPRSDAETVASIEPGTTGLVMSDDVESVDGEQWRQVLTPAGETGWVNDRYVAAQPAAVGPSETAGMTDTAGLMLRWLQGADVAGPEAWLSSKGLWVGGIGVYLDIPTPFTRIAAPKLGSRPGWDQPRNFLPDLEDCGECVVSLTDFLLVDRLGDSYTLNIDAIDPNYTFGYGPREPFAGAHSVTADKPDSEGPGGAAQDWQRITMWFEWSSEAPKIFAISTWGWTP